MRAPFKFLLVGLGAIGQRHARNLRTLLGDDVEFIAWRQRFDTPLLTDAMQVEAGQDVESRFRLRIFTDLKDALSEKPDAVFIANPTSLHLQVALDAARA